PVHTYAQYGTYSATLTVTDQLDGSGSQAVTVTVSGTALCGNGHIDAGEACDGGSCCTAACQFAPNATPCSDGNLCNGSETCQGGTCTSGPALLCNDGNVCTTDTCVPATGC